MAKTTCCNIHPFHCQNTGVCSYCLRERLANLSPPPQFSSARSIKVVAAASYSSDPSSFPASPVKRWHKRNSSGVIGFLGGRVGLRKSKSITFVSSRSRGAGGGVAAGKKRGGFWSTLLLGSSSKVKRSNDVLKHSRTVK